MVWPRVKDQEERGVNDQVLFSNRGLTFGNICLGFNDVQPISSMNKRGHIVELVQPILNSKQP